MIPIYPDYNATTPLDPAVVEAMLPYLRQHFGNPSSSHAYGKIAHDAVDAARRQVAELLGAEPKPDTNVLFHRRSMSGRARRLGEKIFSCSISRPAL